MKEISMNNTIGIREFMEVYLNVPYEDEGHLTHEKMIKYLEEKGKRLPTRVWFDDITEEDIMCGNYLLIRAEKKTNKSNHYKAKKTKVIPYVNPLKKGELFTRARVSEKHEKEALRQLRNKVLMEQGLIEDELGDIMTLSEYKILTGDYRVTENVNRIKQKRKVR